MRDNVDNQIVIHGKVMKRDGVGDWLLVTTTFNGVSFAVVNGGVMHHALYQDVTVIGQLEYKPNSEHPLWIKATQIW